MPIRQVVDLRLSFFLYKVGSISPTSRDYCENKENQVCTRLAPCLAVTTKDRSLVLERVVYLGHANTSSPECERLQLLLGFLARVPQ